MTWVRGIGAQGESLGHIPSWRFNPGGMNQAMAHLKQARRNRAQRRDAICGEIAQRVARFRSLREVMTIEIVDAYYRPEKVFGPERDERPERERVLVRCAVTRPDKA
jgi:hypothetical protein